MISYLFKKKVHNLEVIAINFKVIDVMQGEEHPGSSNKKNRF